MEEWTLILDLGDVLFHWSTAALTALSPFMFHAVIRSEPWCSYERGIISEEQALNNIGEQLSVDVGTIKVALEQCRSTLQVDLDFVAQLKGVKEELNGRIKVYAMTNISRHDLGLLKIKLSDWSLFDGVFASCEAGMRKPDLEFYEHVLASIEAVPRRTILVDDKIDNVIAGRTLGMTGVVFESAPACIRKLHNLLKNPVARAEDYLKDNAGKHHSFCENGVEINDVFAQFLLFEATTDLSLTNMGDEHKHEARVWNYFNGSPIGTTTKFPDDVDTTSYSLLAFSPPKPSADKVLDKMLANRNAAMLVQTYFDITRPRVDPVVLTNVVRAFYKYGRGGEVKECLEFVRRTLIYRGYINGTLYYCSADSFLYFVTRLLIENSESVEVKSLRPALVDRLREHVGRQDDPITVAMRIVACQTMDVWHSSDLEFLKELQEVDGGWQIGWVYKFGRSGLRIGNRGLATAYALNALKCSSHHDTVVASASGH